MAEGLTKFLIKFLNRWRFKLFKRAVLFKIEKKNILSTLNVFDDNLLKFQNSNFNGILQSIFFCFSAENTLELHKRLSPHYRRSKYTIQLLMCAKRIQSSRAGNGLEVE